MEKVLSGEFWFFVQLGAFLVLVQRHRGFYHLCQQDIRPLENLKITYNSVSKGVGALSKIQSIANHPKTYILIEISTKIKH